MNNTQEQEKTVTNPPQVEEKGVPLPGFKLPPGRTKQKNILLYLPDGNYRWITEKGLQKIIKPKYYKPIGEKIWFINDKDE